MLIENSSQIYIVVPKFTMLHTKAFLVRSKRLSSVIKEWGIAGYKPHYGLYLWFPLIARRLVRPQPRRGH